MSTKRSPVSGRPVFAPQVPDKQRKCARLRNAEGARMTTSLTNGGLLRGCFAGASPTTAAGPPSAAFLAEEALWWVLCRPTPEEKSELPPPATRHPLALLAALEHAMSDLNLPPLAELRDGIEESRAMLWAVRERVLLASPGATQMSEVAALVARHLTDWFTRVHPQPTDVSGDILVGQGIVRVALSVIGFLDRARQFEQQALATVLLLRERGLDVRSARRELAVGLVEWSCDDEALLRRRLQTVQEEIGDLPAAEALSLRRGWIGLHELRCEPVSGEEQGLCDAVLELAEEAPEDCYETLARWFESGVVSGGHLRTFFVLAQKSGHLEEAKRTLEAFAPPIPDLEAWMRREDSHATCERLLAGEAPKAALAALQRDDDTLSANLLRGRCFEALDNSRRAKASYDRALELDPQATEALAGFARVELAEGEASNALAAMRAAFQLGHEVGSDALLTAQAAVQGNLLVEAEGWLEVAERRLGDVPAVVATRALIADAYMGQARHTEDPTQANALLMAAKTLEPSLSDSIVFEQLRVSAALERAVAQMGSEEAEKLARFARRKVGARGELDWLWSLSSALIDSYGALPWSLHLLATVAFELGRHDDALAASTAAIQMLVEQADETSLEELLLLQVHIHRASNDVDAGYYLLAMALNRLGVRDALVEEAAEALRGCGTESEIERWQSALLSLIGAERYRAVLVALDQKRMVSAVSQEPRSREFLGSLLSRAETFELTPHRRVSRAVALLFGGVAAPGSRAPGAMIRASEKMGTREVAESWHTISLPKASDAFERPEES